MPAPGGNPVQITPSGESLDLPQESPDGKFLYFANGKEYPSHYSVWKIPVEGGEEIKVLDSVDCSGGWSVWEKGICFFTIPDQNGQREIHFHEFASGRTTKIQTVEREVSPFIAASPDGRTILYPQVDEASSDLMLVENFH